MVIQVRRHYLCMFGYSCILTDFVHFRICACLDIFALLCLCMFVYSCILVQFAQVSGKEPVQGGLLVSVQAPVS